MARFCFRMSSSLCRESAGLVVGFWSIGGVGCEAESAAWSWLMRELDGFLETLVRCGV